jgi:hypothetical protein
MSAVGAAGSAPAAKGRKQTSPGPRPGEEALIEQTATAPRRGARTVPRRGARTVPRRGANKPAEGNALARNRESNKPQP